MPSSSSGDAPRVLSPRERVVPSWTDPLARQATRVLGGPVGRHAALGRQWFLTPLRAVLLFGVLALLAGFLFKAPCIQQQTVNGQPQLNWTGGHQYVAMCYSDVVPLYSAERLDRGAFPYRDSWTEDDNGHQVTRYMEYPVLTGLFQWANAKLTDAWRSVDWLPDAIPVAVYFDVTAFWLALAWLVVIWAVTRTSRRRPWDAALLAISPLVIVHAFTNFDALAVAFAATGMLAWARRRPGLAGVLLGLGAAAKLYPAFLLFPLLLLCLRAGKLRDFWRAAGFAVLAWLAVNLPIALNYPAGWAEFFTRNATRGADPDSLYNVVDYFTSWNGFDPAGAAPTILNSVTAGLFLLGAIGIGRVALAAPRRPRFAQLAFLTVALFLVTSKVWSPQYSLWLIPLAVLAIPRSRLLLGWMTVEAVLWAPRMYYYLEQTNLQENVPDRGLPQGWFLGMVVLRDLVVLGICVAILREIFAPAHDLVRIAGDDDPHGGVLDHAPDVRILARTGRHSRRDTTPDRRRAAVPAR